MTLLRDGLRLVVARTREREKGELVPLVDDRPPVEPGHWTVRDTLAHLTAWRVHSQATLDAVRTGATAPEPIDDFNAENANIYAATRSLSAAAVIEAARRSWDSLAATIDACDEATLKSPRPGRPGNLVWEALPANLHAHLAEHLGYLADDRGDANGAEAAARWAHDLDNEAFPEPRQRGNADYNLACFFAKRGRSAEALPLLRRAFRFNPDLKPWALKDADLDQLRSMPEFTELVA